MTDNNNETLSTDPDVARGSVEEEVLNRYGDASESMEPGLCCPVDYDPTFLKILPQEIIEKDYGCGDPSKYAKEGDTVVDLGSGGGKICYILSQKVGASGHVIGVDFNDRMLKLAHKYKEEMAEKIGHANVEFRKGKIQDLSLNLEKVQAWLDKQPVTTIEEVHAFEAECNRLRAEEKLVETNTVDLVVSNCVLNLVQTQEKAQLFDEIFRALKSGGRAVISDIVCDEDPTPEMVGNAELWSGCISGAFREDEFLERFENAGFEGIEILERQEEPWQVIEGIEFRSLTVRAFKPSSAPCMEHKQAIVYKGPWQAVQTEDGHVYERGKRIAACDRTFAQMTDPNGPYAAHVLGIEPLEAVKPEDATPFDCTQDNAIRSAKETKGLDYNETKLGGDSCCNDGGCC